MSTTNNGGGGDLMDVWLRLVAASMVVVALVPRAARADDQQPSGQASPSTQQLLDMLKQAVDANSKAAQSANDATQKANDKASAAQKSAATANAQAASAAATIEDLKGNKLISSGVTAGIAVAARYLASTNFVDIHGQVSVSAMPYLAVFPGYWGKRTSEGKAYCARSFMDSDDVSAGDAATTISRVKARERLEDLISWLKVQKTADSKFAPRCGNDKDPSYNAQNDPCEAFWGVDEKLSLVAWNTWVNTSPQPAVDLDSAEAKDWIATYAHRIWDRTRIGTCIGTRFGVYAGVPLPTDVEVADPKGSDPSAVTKQTYTGLVGFGGVFAPNAYVALLAGAEYGHLPPADKKSGESVWGFHIGLGGNLDLLSFFSSK